MRAKLPVMALTVSGAESSTKATRLGAAFSLVCLSVVGALLADISKGENHEYEYNPLTVPPVVELTKAVISCVAWLRTGSRVSIHAFDPAAYLLYAIPAACYFVSNSCMFFIVHDLGASQYQILSTMKIFFTAYLMHVFLGRKLSRRQVASTCILVVGVFLTQLRSRSIAPTHIHLRGYLTALLACVSSSVGGVCSEKLLKWKCSVDHGNIHYKNMQLYTWGFAFGMGSWALTNSATPARNFFKGYDVVVCAIVVVLSLSGVSVSYLLKYTDSLVKSMLTALAIAVTTCIQVLRGIDEFSYRLLCGIILIVQALRLYAS